MNFNENQIKAVSHKKGPAMVLAGPPLLPIELKI
jgi:superfamily I DNA/RNA helicase